MSDYIDFWHMNIPNVKKAIIEYTDLKTRCRLSMCSKADRALVESTPLAIRSISVNVQETEIYHYYDSDSDDDEDDKHSIFVNSCTEQKFENLSDMIKCLFYLLKPPNTCNALELDAKTRRSAEDFVWLFDELTFTPKIKGFNWRPNSNKNFFNFLTKLDASYLETCLLDSTDKFSRAQIDRILETEQWKNLKVVTIQNSRNKVWRIDDVLDTPRFSIRIRKIVPAEIMRIVQTFQTQNRPVRSGFHMDFQNKMEIHDFFPEHGELKRFEFESFYLKTFPMPDEECELRVQLRQSEDSYIPEINGVVALKSAPLNPVWVHGSILYDFYANK